MPSRYMRTRTSFTTSISWQGNAYHTIASAELSDPASDQPGLPTHVLDSFNQTFLLQILLLYTGVIKVVYFNRCAQSKAQRVTLGNRVPCELDLCRLFSDEVCGNCFISAQLNLIFLLV